MPKFFQNLFSSGSKPSNNSSKSSQAPVPKIPETAHKLVEVCLKSLPMKNISTGDYYRLYRTLLELKVALPSTSNFSRKQKLGLRIAPFVNGQKANVPFKISSKQLQFSSLDGELARWLVDTFPAVNTLELYVRSTGLVLNQATFECLLFDSKTNWARQLIYLDLDGQKAIQWRACLPKITPTNFPQLKTLRLLANEPLDGSPLDLPILPQLYYFTSRIVGNGFDMIWPTLKAHINDRPEVKRGWLFSERQNCIFHFYQVLAAPLLYEVICTITPRFAAQVKGLSVNIPCRLENESNSSSPPALRGIVRKFTALARLAISLEDDLTKQATPYTLLQVMRSLAQLKSLTYLQLFLKSHKQLPLAGEHIPDDCKPSPKLKQVYLLITKVKHGSFHVPTIVGGLFPAARPVNLTCNCCQTCAGRTIPIPKPKPKATTTSVTSAQPEAEFFGDCLSRVIVGAVEGDIRFS